MPEPTSNVIDLDACRSASVHPKAQETRPATSANKGSKKHSENNGLRGARPAWNKLVETSLSRAKQSEIQAKTKTVPLSDFETDATLKDILGAIKARPRDLPKLCPSSFSSFNAMNGRGQRGEGVVHRRFHGVKGFAAFLVEMGGPKRRASDSIDRINDQDGYLPGNIRWRSKRGQANNRTTTVFIYDPDRRTWGPRAEIARLYGFTPDAVKKAMQRGMDGAHVIAEMCAAAKTKASKTKRGKTKLPEHADDETNASPAIPASIPLAPVRMPSDPRRRFGVELTKAQREAMEQLYQENRALGPDGFEWRVEYAVRFYSQQRRLRQAEMFKLQEAWGGCEPSEAEEAIWAQHEVFRDHYGRREGEAAAALPGIMAELRAYRRQQKPWSPSSITSTSGTRIEEDDDAGSYEADDAAPNLEREPDGEDLPSGVTWGSDLPAEHFAYADAALPERVKPVTPIVRRWRAPMR